MSAGAILWVSVDKEMAKERLSFEQSLSSGAQSIASGYAQYLTRSIDQMDQVTMQLKYDWESSNGALDLRKLVIRGMFTSPQYMEVAIIDRDGSVVTSTASPSTAKAKYAGRSFLAWHRRNISSIVRISAPEADAETGKSLVRFTRRLDSPDDDFDGVVMVTVTSDYFSAFYDAAALGGKGMLAVVGDDGRIRAARIGNAISYPSKATLTQTPRFGLPREAQAFPSNGETWFGPQWFADGDRRFVAWRTLKAYPMTVMAGISESEQIAPLENKWRTYRQIRAAAEAAILALTVVLAYVLHLVERRKMRLRSVQAAYRLATEAGEEGFYMLHPLRAEGRIVDYRILDCNERGAFLLGKGKKEVLGQALSSHYQAEEFARLLEVYGHAMERGSYREEDEFQPIAAPAVRWVRRKAVRSGGDLAVTLRDISDAKEQEGKLIRLANTDELTGLPNRTWFMKSFEATIVRAQEKQEIVALLFIDLDKFKNVNDTLGHATGDKVLQEAAGRLRQALRPTDHVARLGGDEFTVVLQQARDDDEIVRIAQRILAALAQPFHAGAGAMEVGASIGISVYPRDGMTAGKLLKHADIAMYSAKGSRRGTYSFYRQELYDALRTRINMERELAEAIDADQFVLYYQPRVDAASGELLSLEALVRWRHPLRGMVPPLEFIPIAEGTGLITKLGALVLDKSCQQIAQWRAEGISPVPVSVNVSAVQFQYGDVHELLRRCLRQSNISPELIELEITESSMLGEHATIAGRLAAIRELGVKMAVDDFGTGYSSLSQLQRLDMDVLKVDRVFTVDLDRTAESRVLFKAIVSMAHALGMRVVAEGVETQAQAAILRELGCDELQGYLISKPVSPDETRSILRRSRQLISPRNEERTLRLATSG
ncbi:MAG TPA: EAL domain-containing protein [Noviherbaspirillum sp.]|uniref:bifunctional diguanylate cyclase/phosphodiesterase n=1 Tax=Noviherbaspirillum sp. TaxID=1926288 RepID=UPI002B48B73B|nr:EAL domain-containing protein [Noviherbaspirillum sp.]HJV85206.1 EAL domain-containing protein [Noviherbaspirillum sp.]